MMTALAHARRSAGRSSVARRSGWIATALLVATAALAPAGVAAAGEPLPAGNPDCAAVQGPLDAWKELKLEDEQLGDGTYASAELTVSIAAFIDSESGRPGSFDWTSSRGIDAVIVKAGTDRHTVHRYSPEARGDVAVGPQAGSGNGISHISFCYDIEPGEGIAPVPSVDASAEPDPTPTLDRAPSAEPTRAPEPTLEPTVAPTPTAKPTPALELSPSPTDVARSTPAPTQETSSLVATPAPTQETSSLVATPAPTQETSSLVATPAPTQETSSLVATPAPTEKTPPVVAAPAPTGGTSSETDAPRRPLPPTAPSGAPDDRVTGESSSIDGASSREGAVLGARSDDRLVMPSTDTKLTTAAGSPASDAWRLVLIAVAGMLGLALWSRPRGAAARA